MVQYWQILNLDKRETLGQDAWGEMHDIVKGGAPDALVYQLAAGGAADALKEEATRNSVSDSTPNDTNNTNDTQTAPSESVGSPVSSSSAVGSWSGDRIVIISDYALAYPQGMLTPSEMDEIEDMYLDSEDGDEEYDEDDPAPTLYAFAEEWYAAVPMMRLSVGVGARRAQDSGMPQTEGQVGQERSHHDKDQTTLTQGQSDQQLTSLQDAARGGEIKGAQKDKVLSVGRGYHLRNITKKEYVRSEAIGAIVTANAASGLGHRPPQSKRPAPGLGHALVVLGCWTSEVERFAGREVGEGNWAGDKVEVRLASEAPEAENEGWKDVSEGAAGLLEAVWSVLTT